MTSNDLTLEEKKISIAAAKRLGIGACLVFKEDDGTWCCDPLMPRMFKPVRLGFGSTAEEAIKDCARENGLSLKEGVTK